MNENLIMQLFKEKNRLEVNPTPAPQEKRAFKNQFTDCLSTDTRKEAQRAQVFRVAANRKKAKGRR